MNSDSTRASKVACNEYLHAMGAWRIYKEREMLRSRSQFAAALASIAFGFGSGVVLAGTKTENGVEVRDWQAVDTNKDGSISPEEMEKFLQDTWAKNKGK
jgi:EF hand